MSLGLILGAGPVAATERRALSPAEHRGWQAIGRVTHNRLDADGICTGTLVAPQWVLTAGHCVANVTRPETVFFAAGWYHGAPVAARRAIEIILDPRRQPDTPLTMSQIPYDVALLRLEQPIRRVIPLPLMPPGGALHLGGPVSYVTYSNHHPHILSGQFGCTPVQAPESVILTDCPVSGGNSGGPVLRETARGWHVLGVLVARGPSARVASIGVLPQEPLLRHLQPQAGSQN